jgi:hypothetical protein
MREKIETDHTVEDLIKKYEAAQTDLNHALLLLSEVDKFRVAVYAREANQLLAKHGLKRNPTGEVLKK